MKVAIEEVNGVLYRQVQLHFTSEIEIFFMLFERCRTNKRAMAL